MAVRLAIRPRLTLPPEGRPAVARRRLRLPPLALPATGYWLAMGALTYVFAHLGAHPLDTAQASEREAPSITPAPPSEPPAPPSEPVAEPYVARPTELANTNEPIADEPIAATEAVAATEAPPAAVAKRDGESEHEHEKRENREAGRRGDFAGSRDEPAKREEPARVAMSFPEFTDSSRPAKTEHAGDGPRIDSLFEKADERPRGGAPADAPGPELAPDAPTSVSSCEAAIARNNEQITIGGSRGPADTTREAYAGILQNGRYLSSCSIPERSVFEICAAVKDGRAIGITVVSSPASPKLNACVARAVARLKFPQNQRLDVTHTRFDAARP